MKMSNFTNSTWRMAAILKIVISPYLSRKSSEFWRRKRDKKNQKFPNLRWRTDAIFKIIFLPITRLYRVRLRQNFEFGSIIVCTRRLGDENVQFRKSNMADGRHFENHISISQLQMVRIARNLVCRPIFYSRQRKWQKNQKFTNSKWRMDAALKITFCL